MALQPIRAVGLLLATLSNGSVSIDTNTYFVCTITGSLPQEAALIV